MEQSPMKTSDRAKTGRSKRKKSKPKPKRSFLYNKLNGTTDSLNPFGRLQLSLLNSGLMPTTDEDRLTNLVRKKPVDVSQFPKHLALLRKYDILLRAEFRAATKGEPHSTRHGSKPGNEEKNSYKKLIPYDYNRVVLEPIPGVPDSDYINASYIDVMCVQYWPTETDKPDVYGDLEITLLSEESLANFMIRTIRIRKNEEVREIIQMHYTSWPAYTVPFPASLLEFRRIVLLYMDRYPKIGPLVVHCSDGCGRTGTYLVIDSNLELGEEEGIYDVFGYTKQIACARKGMVETQEQYMFIYEMLEDHYICGKTWFPVSELVQQLKHKSQRNVITRKNEYQREYETICKMSCKFSIGDCAGGHRPENREKNRDVATVPPDNFRPYLTSYQSNDSTDYINAVFADGYTRSKEYIVTEWPTYKTIPNLWSLIYDHDCNSVIVLCSALTPPNAYPPFWPTERERKRKFGPVFTVELVSHNHYQNIKTWIFRVHKKVVSLTELMAGVKGETKTTQLFQITCWPQDHKVPTSTNALVELMNMVERWRQRSTYGPVVVVSMNGRSRAGVYCAANFAIEQVVQHDEVDVFLAVKTVRRHRHQLVENLTEYKYCYDLVMHYVLHFLNKE
ncbi:receptor-type tyrosine-protein phosphatase kappa-like isoform X2 [Tachypleus tridentatus]|uniref:receptor-type tyrosine-protein phosphatase kappa-like isoform X2 n=1 Tax=Tachypleus tridentatus TaxID=6853 RepID=UPI003FD60E1A